MVAQFYRDLAAFVALADRLRASDAEVSPQYLDLLRAFIAGHLAWTRSSPRYTIHGWV